MMTAILAIVGDTWRQSRQQVVFMIMLGIMALILVVAVALPTTHETEKGKQFGLRFISADKTEDMHKAWTFTSMAAVGLSVGNELGEADADKDLPKEERSAKAEQRRAREKELRKAITERRATLSDYEAAVQVWLYTCASIMFAVVLALFLAACAGYFPGLMSSGAIDVVLAKPVSRLTVFAGKYLGGLALFGAALFLFHMVLFVATGITTGVWHARLFAAIGMELFIAAVLYAMLALLGIWSRGPLLPLLLGLIMYLVVDTILGQVQIAQQQGMLEDIAWLDRAVALSRDWIPNFSRMKQAALLSILNSPSIGWHALGVGGAWMAYSLLHGFWLFNRRDY